jgi:hypothetical protein
MSNSSSGLVDAVVAVAVLIGGTFASLVGWTLGKKMFPPKSQDEIEKRLSSALISSFTFGVALFVYTLSYQHENVKSLIDAVALIGIKPIFVYGYLAAVSMAITGLFGWWIFLLFAALVLRRAEKFKKQIEDDLDRITGDSER